MPTVLPASSEPTNFDFSQRPGRHRSRGLRHPAQEREEDGEGVLDGGHDVARRGIQNQDAARGSGRHVDVVHTDARSPDDGQLRRRGKERGVDFRGAANQQSVGVHERLEERLARGAREVHDLVTRLPQQVQPGGRDLLRDDDPAHDFEAAAAAPAEAASSEASSSAARSVSSEAMSTSPMWPIRNVEAFHFP